MMTDKQYAHRKAEIKAEMTLAKHLCCKLVIKRCEDALERLHKAYLKPDKTGYDGMNKGNYITTTKYE